MSNPRNYVIYSDKYFHYQLKKAREYRGFKSQAAICRRLNILNQTWSLWEKGERKPGIPQLIEIANLLKLDLAFFFLDSANPVDYDIQTV